MRVQTNIVIFDAGRTGIDSAEFNTEALKQRGVLMNDASKPREVRAVTHYDVTREDCAKAAQAVAELVKQVGSRLRPLPLSF